MKNLLFTLSTIIALVMFSTNAYSLLPPPDPAPIPLDPVSWILLASGAAIAGKKYYDYKKSENSEK